MYNKAGNIWICIGFHILWNYAQGCIYNLQVSGMAVHGLCTSITNSNNLINGGDFGPKGELAVTISIALCFIAVTLLYRDKTKPFR